MSKIEIVIADDHKLFAQGLANILNKDPDLEVKAIFNDGRSMIDYLQNQKAQVALIDLNMPLFNGESTLARMNEVGLACKKIVITMYADEGLLKSCISLGIDAYLLKDQEPDTVIQTIKEVVGGTYQFKHYLPTTADTQKEAFKDDFVNAYKLSKREVEVLQLVIKGLTSGEIADKLFLSVFTVETHRRNIHQKLKVKNTAELVKLAMQQKLVEQLPLSSS
ncbi:LuxR C-terminal-related transcriptional regulator [Rufibacter sp. LB8]|uniref:response regulator transcription factor n=1 Tax=Rufibacter sp. LB8 TaxID=2777781 RepID=UPI00178C4169|nr:response regulator transcription factor [Rufibacter sp. LB8]